MTNYINDGVIDKVKESADIVDIISSYIQLKKSGSNLVGLCPFHGEKTPSFTVSEAKQYFHCFGCGEGGDSITFIMKKENLSFIDAVKFLADKYNIQIETREVEDKSLEEKDRLFNINKETARFFLNNLNNNKRTLEYLYNRQISPKTINQFGLGYASDSWENLYRYLISKGYKSDEIEKLGLIGKKSGNNGYYDKYRNRIMFPIIDTKSRVIGFGGRVMDDTMPKYLNSSDSIIFNKGNYLYGLNLVSKYSDRKKILLVEGYMDVISLFSRGINYVVASLGTALTDRQAKLLKRYGEEIYVCYDSDAAGTKATLRAIDILVKEDIKPRIVVLPDGMDPDDYIKEKGNLEFNNLLNKSLNYIDYQIGLYKNKYDIETIDGKIQFTLEVANLIKTLSPIEQDAFIKKVSQDTNISIEAIQAEVRSDGRQIINKANRFKDNKISITPVNAKIISGNIKAELDLLLLMLQDKDYFDIIKDSLSIEDFSNEDFQIIYHIIIEEYKDKTTVDIEEVISLYSKIKYNQEVVDSLKNHNLNYPTTKMERIISDLMNTLILNRLELKRRKVILDIGTIENKSIRDEKDDELFLEYCKELNELNNKIKLLGN